MNNQYNILKKKVIDTGLCTRCGACIGLTQNSIEMQDPLGKCLPKKTKRFKNNNFLNAVCPGFTVPFSKINNLVFKKEPTNKYLGNYIQGYIGHSNNEKIRHNAASGGTVSTITKYLLSNKKVDGVIMIGPDKSNPCKNVPRIVTEIKEIKECAQSVYSITSTCTIISDLEKKKGKFAFIGTPCQIHAMRKLQLSKHPVSKKIKYYIGIYCGNILHFDSIKSYLARYNITDLNKIKSIKYREGSWPGKLHIELKNGKILSLEKFKANYLIPFYIMKRCLYCIDFTNEFADISCGDGWSPLREKESKGWSVILARTKKGSKLLKELEKNKEMYLKKISEKKLLQMHSHGFDFKKIGALIRINILKNKNKMYPIYGTKINCNNFSYGKIIKEKINYLIFNICSTKLAKKMVNLIPLSVIGFIFVRLRKKWLKKSKKLIN